MRCDLFYPERLSNLLKRLIAHVLSIFKMLNESALVLSKKNVSLNQRLRFQEGIGYCQEIPAGLTHQVTVSLHVLYLVGQGKWIDLGVNIARLLGSGEIKLVSDHLLKSLQRPIRARVATFHFQVVFLGFLSSCHASLVSGYSNCRQDCTHAPNCLNPCRPVNANRWAWLRRMFAQHSPSQKSTCGKGHYSYHRPIPVCSSLLHTFPLLLARILPSGVAA